MFILLCSGDRGRTNPGRQGKKGTVSTITGQHGQEASRMRGFRHFVSTFALSAMAMNAQTTGAAASTPHFQTKPIPEIVRKDGRYALMVDGAPYLILGAQCHNSSAWPAMLPKVWRAIENLHANTLEIPVYWEQFEPEPGKYDTSVIDTIIDQARERKVRLVLLWFATWKNGSSHYIPLWAKRQPENFPRIIGKSGRIVDSPSPHSPAALQADLSAFSAFMRHLKQRDTERTVIMGQRARLFPGGRKTLRRTCAPGTAQGSGHNRPRRCQLGGRFRPQRRRVFSRLVHRALRGAGGGCRQAGISCATPSTQGRPTPTRVAVPPITCCRSGRRRHPHSTCWRRTFIRTTRRVTARCWNYTAGRTTL